MGSANVFFGQKGSAQQKRLRNTGLRPYPLRFHVEEAGADAKLIQQGPLGVAYHCRHPISTVPVARITAHSTVPGLLGTFHNKITQNSFHSFLKKDTYIAYITVLKTVLELLIYLNPDQV